MKNSRLRGQRQLVELFMQVSKMKKMHNNHGSTLVIALVIVLIIATIASITMALIGANVNASYRKLQKIENKLILENKMYEYLAKIKTSDGISLGETLLDENLNNNEDNPEYKMIIINDNLDTNEYSFELTNISANITLKTIIIFNASFNGYTVKTWGY